MALVTIERRVHGNSLPLPERYFPTQKKTLSGLFQRLKTIEFLWRHLQCLGTPWNKLGVLMHYHRSRPLYVFGDSSILDYVSCTKKQTRYESLYTCIQYGYSSQSSVRRSQWSHIAHTHGCGRAFICAIIIFELKYLFVRLRRSANCSVPVMVDCGGVCVCASFDFCCGTLGMGS